MPEIESLILGAIYSRLICDKKKEMGNCCPTSDEQQVLNTNQAQSSFTGEGRRLGTGDESKYQQTAFSAAAAAHDDLPEPNYDPKLTDDEREKTRADRARAAEARLKMNGGKPKRKPSVNSKPLVGPNSKPLMQWTAG
jgi:hypothetical protein